jgi:hypothetical protein
MRWVGHEDEILINQYGNLNYADISDLLEGRTWSAVRNRARFLGLTGKSNLGRKYSANKSYFSRLTTDNCYWAGFIAADGCISDRGKISIGLSKTDSDHLEKLRLAIGYNGPITYYENKATLAVSCKEMADDLGKNFNIFPRKSLTLVPPSLVSHRHTAAFINGLIDGDGSVVKRPDREYWRIVIYGTEPVCSWVKGFVDCVSPATNYKSSSVLKIKNNSIYRYCVSANRAIVFARELLSVKLPRLSRKWNLISEYV